jgi:XRE family aerobic/anaerobic benzoate catabolism transcriptional regulator
MDEFGGAKRPGATKGGNESMNADGPAKNGNEGLDADALARSVGQRLRLQRTRRQITRRELSARTDISERYLGEIERGKANVSLGLLARISETMGLPLSAFIPADGEGVHIARPLAKLLARMSAKQQSALYRRLLREADAQRESVRGIALIGLRGAGKSTLGAMLAKSAGVPFVRLTDTIQDVAGMPTGELLEMMGANAYRRLERQALEKLVARPGATVLEGGGGLVLETETFNLLMRSFRVVWLRAEPEDHMKRVLAQGDLRPVAGNSQAMDEMRLILQEREPYYSQADYVIDTSGKTVEQVFAELQEICAPVLAKR